MGSSQITMKKEAVSIQVVQPVLVLHCQGNCYMHGFQLILLKPTGFRSSRQALYTVRKVAYESVGVKLNPVLLYYPMKTCNSAHESWAASSGTAVMTTGWPTAFLKTFK